MNKYKIGDRVKIREDLEVNERCTSSTYGEELWIY